MFELFRSGGFLMWPILACSAISVAIIIERFWFLRRKHIAPDNLVRKIWQWERAGQLSTRRVQQLREGSLLGRILAAGLSSRYASREVMKQSIEDVGRHVTYELEHFLNTLGTIASITPLLGLLGTVIGMIKVFAAITLHGVGDPSILAEGISEALITTAFGLSVAIPSLMLHRYFQGLIDGLVVTMEQEALKLVDALASLRARESSQS